MNRIIWVALIAVCMLVPITPTDAQRTVQDNLYGRGVHQYFSGMLQEAVGTFSDAIKMGSNDPRVYYFRGLSLAQAGDTVAAQADFDSGAHLEMSSTGRYFAIGRSLERVQGPIRLQLEKARASARIVAGHQKSTPPAGSLVRAVPVIPDAMPNQGNVTPTQTNFPDVSNQTFPGTPFTNVPTQPTKPLIRKRTETAPADLNKDAAGISDAGAADVEPATDPFGNPLEKQPAPKADDDPFAQAQQPADSKEAAKQANPFGGSDTKKAQEKPAEKPPAEKSDKKDDGPEDDPFDT